MSAPRSKRNDASVDSASRLLVRRTETGSNQALSNAARAVPGADLGIGAAHDPGHRLRPRAVGDDQHVAVELPLDAVQRSHRLSRPRAANPQLASGKAVEVERVHRLAQLEHHVVRDVDYVVDGPDVRRFETRRHPGRRRTDPDLGYRRRVAGTERERVVLDGDGQRIVADGRFGDSRPGDRVPVDRRNLAGNAGDAQAIGPVGRDFQVEDRVLAARRPAGNARRRIDRRYLEPVRGERLGQLVDAHRYRNELTEPRNQDFQ